MDRESPAQALARITQETLAAAEQIGHAPPLAKAAAVVGTGATIAGATALTLLLAPGPDAANAICGRCG